jgi:Spy/CpxP family protein refolding chaperone
MGGYLTDDDREALGRIFMRRAQERLGLNDQQAEDIQAALKTMRDDSRADLQALCLARQDLRQLLAKQDSDPAALRAAADRVKALQGKLLDRRVEGQLALRSKLTADQWAKWLELRKGMGHRRMGRGRAIAS